MCSITSFKCQDLCKNIKRPVPFNKMKAAFTYCYSQTFVVVPSSKGNMVSPHFQNGLKIAIAVFSFLLPLQISRWIPSGYRAFLVFRHCNILIICSGLILISPQYFFFLSREMYVSSWHLSPNLLYEH